MQGKRVWLTLCAVTIVGLGGCDRPDVIKEDYVDGAPNGVRPATVTEPIEAAQFLPPTGQRGLVINRCNSCHSVACVVVGDRTEADWHLVERSHNQYVPGMSVEDRGKIFDYLIEHFPADSEKPEVPERMLPGGCPQLPPDYIPPPLGPEG